MSDQPIEKLNLLDTDYAEVLANSSHPAFELGARQLGLDAEEARLKTDLIMRLQQPPQTPEEWEQFIEAWERACGHPPSNEQVNIITQMLWLKGNTDA